MLRENQVQKLLQSEVVFYHSNALAVSYLAFYLAFVPKLHFQSSELQDIDWKILVIIPAQTG